MVDELVSQSPPPIEHPFSLNSHLNTYFNVGLPVYSPIPSVDILNSTGKLSINNQGKVAYATASDWDAPYASLDVETECDAVINVEQGAALVIGADDKNKQGRLYLNQNSTVHIHPGGTLRVTSDQSALVIQPGTTLILDPGAIVRLESPGAKIRIEGKLIVNGDIDFAGTGFFEFAGSNQLEYGPGYTTFRLAGAGISQRFIRIESELRVPAGRNIDLRQGAVQIDGDRLALLQGSGGSFTDILFYGAAANGVQGDHSASFYASGCRFDGFAYPVHLSGGTGTARLLSCTLSGYTGTGVFSEDRPQLLLEQCTLNSPSANDGIYSKHTTLVVQRQTTITGAQSGTYANNGPSPNNDPLLTPPAKTGVRLEGGWLYWMDGGEISGPDVGIANLDGYPTNVYMNHFATVRDCYAGVAMRGNATTGLVAMNCARLINNYYGIHGRDVALMIDPALFNGQSQQAANANVFIRPVSYGPASGSEYFHICYGLKTPPNPVPATQNYWGNMLGAAVSTDLSPSDHKTFCYNPAATGGCGASTAGCVLIGMNTAPQVGRQPTGCPQPGFVCDDPDGSCIESCTVVVTGGESSTVRDQFLAAMEDLHNEDFPTAKSGFQPPADLWGPGSLTFTPVCRTYVIAARSLTDGAAPESGEERRYAPKFISRLHLAPNPASESVNVQLDEAVNFDLEVWDMQGRLMHRVRVSGSNYHLNVADWPVGLYLVKAISEQNLAELIKLSIVKL